MPLLYVTPQEVLDHPLGVSLAAQLASLQPGALDSLLFRASQRCNTYCKRRLQAPQTTTVASPGITAGATVLPVASTLGTDNKEEFAVQVGSGGVVETLDVLPGGVTPTSPLPGINPLYPYPGTYTLATPCIYNHAPGESVVGLIHEIRRSGSQSEEDIYEQIVTQQAQVAAAHAGGYDFLNADRTKYHWLYEYPLIQLLDFQHAYPYSSEYTRVDIPSLSIEYAISRIRFPVGSFILSNGLLKALYSAGYQNIPDEIKDAVIWYLRDMLQAIVNPYALISSHMGKRTMVFANGKRSPSSAAAEEILGGYER